MLQSPPSQFEVTFNQPMALKRIALTDDTDSEVAVTATPAQPDASSATVLLPQLDPGTYKLHWVGSDANGNELAGDLSFMVHHSR
ncbi:copper resistance protein CopC [Sphingomonas sp. So64.6b]|nr:copper resistance protein CopC [Sphingomonas sp. So64.6b]